MCTACDYFQIKLYQFFWNTLFIEYDINTFFKNCVINAIRNIHQILALNSTYKNLLLSKETLFKRNWFFNSFYNLNQQT